MNGCRKCFRGDREATKIVFDLVRLSHTNFNTGGELQMMFWFGDCVGVRWWLVYYSTI